MLKIGWKAGPEQFPPRELLQYAVDAERAGFEFIDVSDHFNPWSPEGQAPFTWTWLGAVSAQTSRIEMGTGVTCPILRYHPAIIAQAAATLSQLAPGRVHLGVGTGEALNEYAATGLWPGYDERQARLQEAIELIRTLWSGEEVTYEGEFYRTRKAKLFTPPAAPIPIYISALVPDSAAFAGKYGDGLYTVGGKQPQLYQQLLKNFDSAAKEAGKKPDAMVKIIELNVEYEDNLEEAIKNQQKYWAGTYVPALFNQKIYTPTDSAENGQIVGADAIKKAACVSSNPEDHVKFAKQYIELGFNYLAFHSARPDQSTFIQKFSRDVVARLRR